MKNVLIITPTLTHYREKFFNRLREELIRNNVKLTLVYGQPVEELAKKGGYIHLEWAHFQPSKFLRLGKKQLVWQPVLKYIKDADLVIAVQASQLLINYYLVLLNLLKLKKVAFWGHGKNLQKDASKIGEWFKSKLSKHVHWWFAYNKISVGIVKELGFPSGQITNVQNAIDTSSLIAANQKLSPSDLVKLLQYLGISSENVCLYIGGMYPGKRIQFLLDALYIIRRKIPDFEMLFIGAGVYDYLVKQAAKNNAWIHYLGNIFGDEKVPYFALSELVLMPSLVGLGILDAFALETPIVTTSDLGHGPEFDYLENNINGIVVSAYNNLNAYAQEVIRLLQDQERINILRSGCKKARSIFTLEKMVENFAVGVFSALHKDL